ncbi:MAG: hypothetical protein H7061_01095 [Bdellovibrionaceae bacterium]|nr:hypothetical protein [Bdellovibrio sp.]
MAACGLNPLTDVVFYDSSLTFLKPDPLNCLLQRRGKRAYVSRRQINDNGLSSSIAKVTVQAKGVTATTVPQVSAVSFNFKLFSINYA